jgi:hypothetical protein
MARAQPVETQTLDYHLRPAKYAKDKWALTPTSDGTGLKTRAASLAHSLANGYYTGREKAYILSRAQAARFVDLYNQGYTASDYNGDLIAPKAMDFSPAQTPPAAVKTMVAFKALPSPAEKWQTLCALVKSLAHQDVILLQDVRNVTSDLRMSTLIQKERDQVKRLQTLGLVSIGEGAGGGVYITVYGVLAVTAYDMHMQTRALS